MASTNEDSQQDEMQLENITQGLQASASSNTEVYSHKEQLSPEPKTDLRLVLFGGDGASNNYVCGTILRSEHREETINARKGNVRESIIAGRRVSVFKAPSYWMEHLDSHLIFSNGVESIRHEIQNCTSTLFPGPHAFLLVMRAGHATGKEHYLLRAITSVFGAEALEYTMVMFIHAHERHHPRKALKDRCVQMCGERFYFLENNDENVEELFMKIETMTQKKKKSRFFVQHSYENLMKMCFESWESTRLHAQQCREHKLIEEMKAEQQLKETELRKNLETLGRAEQDLRKELEASRLSERHLKKELNESNDRSNKLQREVDEYTEREKELQQKLKDLQNREELLHNKLEQQMRQKSEELKVRESQLDYKEKELRARERELEGKAASTEEGDRKPSRRCSKDGIPPHMLENQTRPPDEV